MKHSVRFRVYFNQKYYETIRLLSDIVAHKIQNATFIDIVEPLPMYIKEEIYKNKTKIEDKTS